MTLKDVPIAACTVCRRAHCPAEKQICPEWSVWIVQTCQVTRLIGSSPRDGSTGPLANPDIKAAASGHSEQARNVDGTQHVKGNGLYFLRSWKILGGALSKAVVRCRLQYPMLLG